MKLGEVLNGKYQLLASIGRGGMGEVFRAVHLPSNDEVAIKVVSRAFMGDILMARLEREAEAASRIHSEFVPRALEVDRTEDGELYLVMELLHGEPLSERLKRSGGVLPWDEIRMIGDNVLRALIAAHAARVVHRDLKPANIFLETMPGEGAGSHKVALRARILDFGVCKMDGQVDGERLTVTGESVGTIAYMAPEQIRGASRVDERADLYSFAMVIFELLCGRLAYDAAGQMALLASKLEKPARPMAMCAKVPFPTGLDALVDRALAREPQDRQASAREMLASWSELGPVTPASASLPIVTHAGVTLNPTRGTVATATKLPPPPASRGALLVAGSVLAGCLLVGVTAMRHRIASAGAPEPAETSVAAPVDPPPMTSATTSPSPPSAVVSPSPLPSVSVAPSDAPPPVLELEDHGQPRTSSPHPRAVHTSRPAAPPPRTAHTGTAPSLIEQPHY